MLQVRHQWGMKRYWRAEDATGDNGDVMANQLYLDGSHRIHPRAVLFFGTQLKSKSVQRISNEEAYLRAGIRVGLNATIAPGISTSTRYRRGGDDARDATLSDVSLHEVGWETRYGRTRKLRANVEINRRWLDYNRRAIARDELGVLLVTPMGQKDRTTSLRWDCNSIEQLCCGRDTLSSTTAPIARGMVYIPPTQFLGCPRLGLWFRWPDFLHHSAASLRRSARRTEPQFFDGRG